MKKTYKWMTTCCLSVLILVACNNDDMPRVFKQHLMAQITETETMLNEIVIGSEEGEYREGCTESLLEKIEQAKAIYWNSNTSQQEVDECCKELSTAVTDFSDWMNPYKSTMYILINVCKEQIKNTQIGDEEGMIPEQNDKDLLQTAIDAAEEFMDNNPEITQRELDQAYYKLQQQLFLFEDKIPGKRFVNVENHSFELPGVNNIYKNFEDIPGWHSVGPINGITPGSTSYSPVLVGKASNEAWWLKNREIPDGEYVLHTMCYYDRVWQPLQEFVHSKSRYTLSVDYARTAQWIDSDMRLRLELIVFNGQIGDFTNITVLKELEIVRVEEKADFTKESLIFDAPNSADYIGKRMAICFRSYYQRPWESTKDSGFIWPKNKTGVEVDNVILTCEKLGTN